MLDHRGGRIDRDDVVPGRSEPACEPAGAAAEIEDALLNGADARCVEREVVIARVEQVVTATRRGSV
jgi:hypothetical protein